MEAVLATFWSLARDRMQLRSLFLTELVCDMIAEQGHYKLQRPAQYSARSGAQSQVLSLPAEKSGNAEMFFFVDPGKYLLDCF